MLAYVGNGKEIIHTFVFIYNKNTKTKTNGKYLKLGVFVNV